MAEFERQYQLIDRCCVIAGDYGGIECGKLAEAVATSFCGSAAKCKRGGALGTALRGGAEKSMFALATQRLLAADAA